MRDPYPFRGIWRWAVLPSLLALAGLLGGLAGAVASDALGPETGYWLIQGFTKAAVEGGALAIGRRPLVALAATLVLGGLSVWVEQGLTNAAFRSATPPDSRVVTVLAFGVVSVLMVLVHHLYLRSRRRSPRAALATALLYPVAAVAGMWIYVTAVYPYGGFNPALIAWGVAEGAFAWMALVVAARWGERATTSAPVP